MTDTVKIPPVDETSVHPPWDPKEVDPKVGPGIIVALRPLAVPIDMLEEWGENPRHGQDDAVIKSLMAFGQMSPVVYKVEDGTLKVFAGNTRLRAARHLGWTHLAAVDSKHLDADQIRAFALADNRTSDLGFYDNEALLRVIEAVQAADGDLVEATGYSPIDIQALLPPEPSAPAAFGEVDLDDLDDEQMDNCCPRCGYEWT